LVAKVGGFHGRALQSGDVVEFAGGGVFDRVAPVDTCLQGGMVRVLPGVRVDRFPPESFERLVTSIFAVSPNSDRMGLRLKGPPVTDCPISGSDISEGMAIGSVEVTPKGELLVLLKARGSIGGYPTLAHVIRADWPVLAQAKPGDAMQFEAVTLATAEQAARQRQEVD
jgi:allophanate hydrolase subunit 2